MCHPFAAYVYGLIRTEPTPFTSSEYLLRIGSSNVYSVALRALHCVRSPSDHSARRVCQAPSTDLSVCHQDRSLLTVKIDLSFRIASHRLFISLESQAGGAHHATLRQTTNRRSRQDNCLLGVILYRPPSSSSYLVALADRSQCSQPLYLFTVVDSDFVASQTTELLQTFKTCASSEHEFDSDRRFFRRNHHLNR